MVPVGTDNDRKQGVQWRNERNVFRKRNAALQLGVISRAAFLYLVSSADATLMWTLPAQTVCECCGSSGVTLSVKCWSVSGTEGPEWCGGAWQVQANVPEWVYGCWNPTGGTTGRKSVCEKCSSDVVHLAVSYQLWRRDTNTLHFIVICRKAQRRETGVLITNIIQLSATGSRFTSVWFPAACCYKSQYTWIPIKSFLIRRIRSQWSFQPPGGSRGQLHCHDGVFLLLQVAVCVCV